MMLILVDSVRSCCGQDWGVFLGYGFTDRSGDSALDDNSA